MLLQHRKRHQKAKQKHCQLWIKKEIQKSKILNEENYRKWVKMDFA